MRVRADVRFAWVAVVVLALQAGCGRGEKPGAKDQTGQASAKDEVLARVAGKPIRTQDVEDVRSQLPQFRKADFEGARGTLRLVNQLVDREILIRAAEDQGLDKDPEVAKQLADLRRAVLLQALQKKLVDTLPKPTEEELRAYYDQHSGEFVIPARINASWIKTATKADAEKARRRIVVKGEEFGKVAREVSIDKASAADGGLLGYFNPTGYIRSVGADTAFARRAFELEADDVGEVFPYKEAWAFIKVHEKTTERPEPYDRAKERIRSRLTPAWSDSLMIKEAAQLRQKYKVDILIDPEKELAGKSADDLMHLATEAGDPGDKIEYYRALLHKYPTYERADEAQFMIGFVYSEQMHDFDLARPEYEKMLQDYPQSTLRESAQYMLQNMGHGGALPAFEEPGSKATNPAPAGSTPH